MPTQAATYFPAEEMVTVRLMVRGRTRPVKGAKTGIFYGRFKAGDEFQIHRDDYAAHPVWFQLFNSPVSSTAHPPVPVSHNETTSAANAATPPVEAPPPASLPTPFDLTSVPKVDEAIAEVIQKRFDVQSAEDVAQLTVDQLTSVPKVGAVLAENIIKAAQDAIHAAASG